MTRSILSFCGALAAATTIVAAQTPPPSQQPPAPAGATAPSPQDMNDDHAGKVSVTGCVMPFTAPGMTASQPSATAQASTAGSQFMLSNVGMPTPSSGDSMKAWSPASSYILQGSSVDLSKHLNHKVQITGTVDGAGSPDASTTAGQAAGAPTQTFHVTSLKMIAASCP